MNTAYQLKRIAHGCLMLSLLAGLAAAQQTDKTHPNQDSPELYLSFFFFHEDFAKWSDERVAAAAPADKARVLNSSAKHLGIAPADFAKLQEITSQVVADLRGVGDEARAFVESSKGKGPPDRARLIAFDNRRKAIIQAGVAQMKKSLSPASWEGLSSYVNNQHRQHVHISPPGRQKSQ